MTYDFEAAMSATNNWVSDGDRFINPVGSLTIAEVNLCDQIQTIQFALRFTKAALSGEVGDAAYEEFYDAGVTKDNFGHVTDVNVHEGIKAMCQQLAKEVGNG